MKTKISFILSLISLVGVLSIWGLWIFGSMKLSVVSLDTFVGVIVALLAIVFTVIIGFQIVNAIDMREKMSELEKRQMNILENERQLAENDRLHMMEAYNLQSGISGESADAYFAKGQYIEAFAFYHAALYHAILADQTNQLNRVNQLQTIVQLITTRPVVNYTSLAQQINADMEGIRKTTSYRNCLSEVYEQTMQTFWQKIKLLGLEVPE
ncbi:MAG: hypothetical protein IJJ90_01380 [Prevotella sp.]|nr:hypothetical protein [Prevotella sp.]